MKALLLIVALVFSAPLGAAIDVYQFDGPAQEERFRALLDQLRCPKCQNQSLSGSDADIARDMRARVAQMIRDGYSDDEIIDHFVARYGDFVNYRPPFRAETAVLWFGPVVVFLLGAWLVAAQVRRARLRADDDDGETDR